jgi:hypothetical protein
MSPQSSLTSWTKKTQENLMRNKNHRLNSFVTFLMFVCLLLVSAGAVPGQGQEATKTKAQPTPAGGASRPGRRSHVSSTAAKKTEPSPKPSPSATPATSSQSVTLVSGGQPEYLSGEANINVKGNQNPIIRLGLAQNGTNMIEFPAADSFFMIHPGNSDLVAFDEDTAKLSKRSLVLRPGAAFVAPPQGSASRLPSASVSVQMQSGLVVTFLIYPVRELSQNAHRVVVSYSREEVVASRRAAGLAVNLDGNDPQPPKRDSGVVRFGDYGDASTGNATAPPLTNRSNGSLIADVNSTAADARVKSGKTSKKAPKTSDAANRALKDALKTPAKVGEFSKPTHGLSMAVSAATDLDASTRVLVVAVRNDSKGDLRIVSGNPELYVQTFDDQGKSLQIEQVKKLHVETTSLDNKITSGGVAYYSIVYEAPVMGARQRLRVSVSQTDAADEPATAGLGEGTKRN